MLIQPISDDHHFEDFFQRVQVLVSELTVSKRLKCFVFFLFSSSQSCCMWPAIGLPRTGANADHIFESNLSPACAVFAIFKTFSTKKSLPPLCEKKNIDRSVSIPFWRKLSDLMAKPPKGGGTCSGCLLSHCNPTA